MEKQIFPSDPKQREEEGWFATDDIDEVVEYIDSRLAKYGVTLVEGTDEGGDGCPIGGDWYLRVKEIAPRTITRTRLDIGVSFEVSATASDVVDLCEHLEKELLKMGIDCESSGAGGGYRDMQFDGEEDVELALKAKQFAIEWLTERVGDPGGGAMDGGLWYVGLTEHSYRSI